MMLILIETLNPNEIKKTKTTKIDRKFKMTKIADDNQNKIAQFVLMLVLVVLIVVIESETRTILFLFLFLPWLRADDQDHLSGDLSHPRGLAIFIKHG